MVAAVCCGVASTTGRPPSEVGFVNDSDRQELVSAIDIVHEQRKRDACGEPRDQASGPGTRTSDILPFGAAAAWHGYARQNLRVPGGPADADDIGLPTRRP